MITGVYGQDGSLLAEYLLGLGYRVVGLVSVRKVGFSSLQRVEIIETDIADPGAMRGIFATVQPDECYHLAAHHHSSEQQSSFDGWSQMVRVNFMATQVMLKALLKEVPACRFLYAGSSQMYTPVQDVTVIDEHTPFSPSTFYGITKVASAQLIDLERRERGLWGLTTILFNHESTRRSPDFLSRKVTRSAATFKARSIGAKLELRDLSARTDWSAAIDIVRAMHAALQVDHARDYVLASGAVHTVKELVEEAFAAVDLDWRCFVSAGSAISASPRPCLQGNPERAQRELNWCAQTNFYEMIREMVYHDMQSLEKRV
jgi:GDPmannose 4,6-dehydratase